MRKLLIRVACAALTFSLGLAIHNIRYLTKPLASPSVNNQPPQSRKPVVIEERFSFGDLLTDREALQYNGYRIETKFKKTSDEMTDRDQGYIVLSKRGNQILKIAAMLYQPSAQNIGFGLFSFLANRDQQVAISEDHGRGGRQWIMDVSDKPRLIFDGEQWRVGRESDDCEVRDVDGDGIFELSLPITDFYSFMDKMAVGNVPLPMITFKYDSEKRQYFPANHLLDLDEPKPPEIPMEGKELYFRSRVLDHMLPLIYQGQRQQAWQYFNSKYNLDDKKEIESRVKAILRNQPVYKYIYKNQ